MLERETILPLVIGAVIAVLLHLIVLPLAGQVAQRSAERPALTVTIDDASQQADAGATVSVAYTVRNLGPGRPAFAWVERVYLSDDDQLSGDDRVMTSRDAPRRLEQGEHEDVRVSIDLPPRTHGDMFLIVKADADDLVAVTEPVTSSTTTAEQSPGKIAVHPIRITLPPRPDLVAVGYEGPRHVKPDHVFGGRIETTLAGKPLPSDAQWSNHLYLSNDDQLSGDDAPVLTQRVGTVHSDTDVETSPIPDRYGGKVYVIAKVDADDAIEEYPNEDNNTLVLPIYIERDRDDPKPKPREVTHHRPRPKPERRPKPKVEPDVRLGKDDAPETLTASWIAYEDFQKLLAPKSRVEQPALQRQVDPAPVQRMPDRPTPPATPSQIASVARSMTRVTQRSDAPQLARQVEAVSVVPTPAPPLRRLPADAPMLQRTTPARQAESAADIKVDRAKPLNQDASRATESVVGQPTIQFNPPPIDELKLELPDLTTRKSYDVGLAPQLASDADVRSEVPPTEQAASRTDEPDPDGEPTRQDKADTPKPRDDGAPTKQIAAQTPKPDPDGRPATAKPIPTPAPPKPDPKDVPAKTAPKPTPTDDAKANTRPSPQPRKANPTAAPRDKKEAPAAALKDSTVVRPGKVATMRGVEVRTVRPKFGVVTLLSTFPTNPIAEITFNGDGKVIKARLLRSTGYADLDSPILVSLYQWRAVGKELKKYPNGFKVKMNLLLSD